MRHICFQRPLGRVDRGCPFVLVLIVSLNSLVAEDGLRLGRVQFTVDH